jgi:thiosulfate/3-mercaptopyruvate sulfurtransferase
LIVDVETVSEYSDQPGYALVDARSYEYFSGAREGRVKTGHIPGAGSAHWMEMVDDSLHLKSAAELEQVFLSAGVEPGDTIIGYCHIGQYATVALFAARTLGHEVRLYDGSFQDWAARDLPVETGDSTADSR